MLAPLCRHGPCARAPDRSVVQFQGPGGQPLHRRAAGRGPAAHGYGAGRLVRAQRNFPETFAVFVGAVLMLAILREEGPWSAFGAVAYVAGRIAFLPLYAWGVPWLRTFSWNLVALGLVFVMADVVV
nr:MAPEG family protein [Phenylobacterium sp.]